MGLLPGQEHPPHGHHHGRRRTGAAARGATVHAAGGTPGFEAKIKDYRTTTQKFTTDPESKEGLDELFVKGKSLEAERDVALRKDPYFDWSQALLQIAIVLASVHLIIGNMSLLGLSGGLAGLGVLLMLNGFTLAVACRSSARRHSLRTQLAACTDPRPAKLAMPRNNLQPRRGRHDHAFSPAPAR